MSLLYYLLIFSALLPWASPKAAFFMAIIIMGPVGIIEGQMATGMDNLLVVMEYINLVLFKCRVCIPCLRVACI